jgi:hypothetical protein
MQTLFKKKKININIEAPSTLSATPTPSVLELEKEIKSEKKEKPKKVKRGFKVKVERKNVISTIWIVIKFLILIAICAGVFYKLGNLYLLSLVFFFSFLLLFFVPQEIFMVTSLLTVICAALYLLGYELYYIKVGEFIFVSIAAGIAKLSGVLFERERLEEVNVLKDQREI